MRQIVGDALQWMPHEWNGGTDQFRVLLARHRPCTSLQWRWIGVVLWSPCHRCPTSWTTAPLCACWTSPVQSCSPKEGRQLNQFGSKHSKITLTHQKIRKSQRIPTWFSWKICTIWFELKFRKLCNSCNNTSVLGAYRTTILANGHISQMKVTFKPPTVKSFRQNLILKKKFDFHHTYCPILKTACHL